MMRDEIGKYLASTLKLKVEPRRWPAVNSLPAYLSESYEMLEAKVLGMPCLFISPRSESGVTSAAAYSKHRDALRKKWHGEVVFAFRGMDASLRSRLIDHGIPFIVPGNQMYLPMWGLDLREHFLRQREPKKYFSPATQVLVLNVIYRRLRTELTTKDVTENLGYSIMTANRAFDELADVGLGEYGMRGKERRIRFGSPRETWNLVRMSLRSPVRNRFREMTPSSREQRIKGGLAALSFYSNLADPEIPTYVLTAASKSTAPKGLPDKLIEFETWRYQPLQTGKGNAGYADPLSVYLSMEGEYDERISQAREQLLERMEW